MEEQRENAGRFPLQKLPWLVTAQIIRSMETWEQIRLCLTSNKMEIITRSVKLRPMHYECYFYETKLLFASASKPSNTYFFGHYQPGEPRETLITDEEMSKWMGPTDGIDLEKTIRVFDRVISIIPSNFISVVLYPPDISITTLQNVFSHPVIKHCGKIFIDGRGITTTSEFLDYVLNTASRLRHLTLLNTNPPYGYYHEKMFRIEKFECTSSEWISIETLLRMKHFGPFNMGKTRLSYADLNRFLKYWVHSEVDMFHNFIYIEMEDDIPEDVLFDGIVRLKSNYFRTISYFIKADSKQQQRYRSILNIWYDPPKLKLTAWSPDQHWQNRAGEADSFQGEYAALRVVERRKELEKRVVTRYGNIKLKIRELNEQLEQLQEELDFTIDE